MKKLTAEKCCQLLDSLNSNGMSILEGYYVEALEIALPILEQQEREQEQGEGEWIEWGGGDCPVPHVSKLMVKLRSGNIRDGKPAINWGWRNTGSINDIIAYRIIPEQPTNQNGEQ